MTPSSLESRPSKIKIPKTSWRPSNEVRLIGVKIERFKDETQSCAQSFERYYLLPQENGDNSLSFQPKNQSLAGMGSDSRIWRSRLVMTPCPR